MKSSQMVEITDNPLETLRRCGGYYSCPKDSSGRRLGPLVGYAGRDPATGKQLVGDVYANFAKAEEFPHVLHSFATQLGNKPTWALQTGDIFCGAPLGGYSLANMLGFVCDRRVIKAEKKITALATKSSREKSELIFGRHEVKSGDKVIIVEDVCNNFSTTDQLITLINYLGGRVAAIACLLNRSSIVENVYGTADGIIPVISLVYMPIPEYKQEDPAVSEDIARGNVVLKPKNEWPRLMAAMDAAKSK
jgi:orotate phosphoribosyltransferase